MSNNDMKQNLVDAITKLEELIALLESGEENDFSKHLEEKGFSRNEALYDMQGALNNLSILLYGEEYYTNKKNEEDSI